MKHPDLDFFVAIPLVALLLGMVTVISCTSVGPRQEVEEVPSCEALQVMLSDDLGTQLALQACFQGLVEEYCIGAQERCIYEMQFHCLEGMLLEKAKLMKHYREQACFLDFPPEGGM